MVGGVEAVIYLDTHTVVWLYAGETERLSAKARAAVESQELRISPMVLLELQYLREIGRISVKPEKIRTALALDLGLHVCALPMADAVAAALGMDWTRDPFDRLICGHAAARNAGLVTKDETLRAHFAKAIW